jgi:hypothetical protein
MPELIAPLAHFLSIIQQAVHRANRAQITVFVEQRGVNLGGRLIDEPLGVQRAEHDLPLLGRKGSRRRGPWLLLASPVRDPVMTVERGPRHTDRRAGRSRADFAG